MEAGVSHKKYDTLPTEPDLSLNEQSSYPDNWETGCDWTSAERPLLSQGEHGHAFIIRLWLLCKENEL